MASLRSDAAPSVRPGVRDVTFPLPSELQRYGGQGRATLVGAPGAPVVAMLGGISGNRFPCLGPDGEAGWWHGLAGDGKLVDPARCRILGLDFIADESGACAPTPLDQARALIVAMEVLAIDKMQVLVGASYGGMVTLALAEAFPERVERIVIISADAAPHPTSTASRELQRRVVRFGVEQGRGREALAIARGMAMLTYRSPEEFAERFEGGIDGEDPLTPSDPGGYLAARGEAYRAVMSPGRFLSLSASIDRHRCDPARITTPATLIGALSDQLVPPGQMRALAQRLAGPAQLHLLACRFGHDMFLKEAGKLADLLGPLF
jgi:homoserine O-acetyltransferase/O-succinyltransferase